MARMSTLLIVGAVTVAVGAGVVYYGYKKGVFKKKPKNVKQISNLEVKKINGTLSFMDVVGWFKKLSLDPQKDTPFVALADKFEEMNNRYIASSKNVEITEDIGYGKGYTLAGKEFDECLRKIVQMNYGLVLISHAVDKTFTDESGKEYNQIVPTLGNKPRNIVARMCDIIGYSRGVQNSDGTTSTKLFMRGTPRYVAGSRFKYTPDYIDFTYKDLCAAISDAIDKQMAEDGTEYFTDTRNNLYIDTTVELNFDELMKEFQNIIANIPGSTDMKGETEEGVQFREYWQPRITQCIEKYLGKGKKIKDATRDQVEAIDLIVTELKDLVKYKEV